MGSGRGRGQLSAEMLILLALVLGLLLIVYVQLSKTTTTIAGAVDKRTGDIVNATALRCQSDNDCPARGFRCDIPSGSTWGECNQIP